ncbi:MAG: hypothetical protein RIG62_13315 [Cyclobacteriaceae bacterium]
MRNIVKALSHKDRVFGRIISGGSVVSKDQEGKILMEEIQNGFFEKETARPCLLTPKLYLPYNLFNSFRNIPLN